MALAKRPGSSQGQGMQPWQPRQPPPSQQQAALAQRTQSQPGVGLSLGMPLAAGRHPEEYMVCGYTQHEAQVHTARREA